MDADQGRRHDAPCSAGTATAEEGLFIEGDWEEDWPFGISGVGVPSRLSWRELELGQIGQKIKIRKKVLRQVATFQKPRLGFR